MKITHIGHLDDKDQYNQEVMVFLVLSKIAHNALKYAV